MTKRIWIALSALTVVVGLSIVTPPILAQLAPGAFSTVQTTNATATSICAGCPLGSTTPADNSGVTAASVALKDATPSPTTNKIYNVAGALYFNGLALATGSSISGSTGTVPKFTGPTTLGNSNATISGTTWTIAGPLIASSYTGGIVTGSSGVFTGNVAGATGSFSTSVTAGTWTTLDGPGAGFVRVSNGASAGVVQAFDTTYRTLVLEGSTVDFKSAGAAYGRLHASGGWSFIDQTDPGTGAVRVAGKLLTTGALYLGGTNITDSVGTPTIGAGFGSSPSIAGNNYAFVIVVGTGSPTTGTVNLSQALAHPPVCVASSDRATYTVSVNVSNNTDVVINTSSAMTASDVIKVLCRGY